MSTHIKSIFIPLLFAIIAFHPQSPATAADALWRVAKSSGETSVTSASGEKASLAEGTAVNPGDKIRTGQTGRVLLKRGEETILISPNSAIDLPAQKASGLTTIIQQAGSILLEVEKRNVKHFSVETPYLAAVVKGTQFRVTVNNNDSRVDVVRGQVEVQDFKSGQYAMVMPNQAATVSALGSAGLLLSGSGAFNPIQQGLARSASAGPGPAPAPAPVASASQPTRMASAPVISPARTWTPTSSSNDSDWTSMFKGLFSTSGRSENRHEEIALAAAFSGAVGFFVTIAVTILRRRKNKQPVKT